VGYSGSKAFADIKASEIKQMQTLFISQYEMSIYERRLLLKIIEKLPQTLPVSGAIDLSVTIEEISQSANLKGDSVYTQIQQASRELIRHVCQLKQTDGLLQISLLSSAKYLKGSSRVDLRIDGRLMPYLSQIKSEFSLVRLSELMSFQSYYTQCLYELFLREATDRDQFYITLADLRRLLKVEDKYDRYADFRRRILLQAQSDLKEFENAAFLFKPEKERFTGKVIGIHFFFRKLLTSKARPGS
jgi:plasmid replication initiation protein